MINSPATPVVTRPAVITRERPLYNYRAIRTTWFIVGVVEALVAIRFVLQLLGASSSSAFVALMYGVTAPLVAPFRGIFGTFQQADNVWDPAALVAMVVYLLIGLGVVALIRLLTTPKQITTVR